MNFPDNAINLLDVDFPYGRWSSQHHEGRKFVNRLIASLPVRYIEAEMIVRKDMITRVLEAIASNGGRIKRRAENDVYWYPVSNEEARKIVANLFHEGKRTRMATLQNPANQLPQAQPLQPPRHIDQQVRNMAHQLPFQFANVSGDHDHPQLPHFQQRTNVSPSIVSAGQPSHYSFELLDEDSFDQNEFFNQDNQDRGASAVGMKELHYDDNGEKQQAVTIHESVDLYKLQSRQCAARTSYFVADTTTTNCNDGNLGVRELDKHEAKSSHDAGGYDSRHEEPLQPPVQDVNIQQQHDDVAAESVLRSMPPTGSEGSMEDAEIRQLLVSTLSPRNSPSPNEDIKVSPDSSLTDTQQYVSDRATPAGGFNPRNFPLGSAGANNNQARQAPQPQLLVELLPSLPLSSGVRVESASLQRQYVYSTGRPLSCISAILRCMCDRCERPFELCHFGTTIDCPFCAPDTASGNPGSKTGQNGSGGYGSNRKDMNWSSHTDGHSHGGCPPGSGRGGQPFGGAPGQNNIAHSRQVAGALHSSTQSESHSDHSEQHDDAIANMKAGDDDEPMDSPVTSDLAEDAVLASAFSVACTLKDEPKQTTAPDQHVASDLTVADASKNATDRGFSNPNDTTGTASLVDESHTKGSFLNRPKKGSSDGINLMLQTMHQSRYDDVQMSRDTSGQLTIRDEAIDEKDFVVLPSELQNSDGQEPREDDTDFNLSKVLHRDSLAEASPHDVRPYLPYDPDLERAVERYNLNVSVDALKVRYENVVKYTEELAQVCDGGMWRSLVYDPWDMSVYVRRLAHDDKGEELTVDVALCTQDFTWRSNNTLKDVQECDDDVGRSNEIESVPTFNQLPRIVQHVAEHRVVHAVRRYGRQVTIELAHKFIEGRNNPSYVDIQFPEKGKLRTDFDKLSSRRKPGDRVELIDMDIMYAWFICMYLMKRTEGSSEEHVSAVRDFLLDATQDYNEGRMTMNLNYETMFLSRYRTYRDGRLSWPMVLGLVTANNLKPGIADQADLVDVDLASHIGTYNGRYSWRNAVALNICSPLVAVLTTTVAVCIFLGESNASIVADSVALGWNDVAVGVVAGVVALLYVRALKVGSVILEPLGLLKSEKWPTPPLQTLEEATKVLMSEFSTKHFNGTGLEFTGLVYTGKVEFSYRFSYEELFRIGFQRLCDCSGREHLLVPGKEDIVVRLEDDENGFDDFTRVELPPNQRFVKLWIPNNDGPGDFYRSKTNASTSVPRPRPRPRFRDGDTVISAEDVEDLDDLW